MYILIASQRSSFERFAVHEIIVELAYLSISVDAKANNYHIAFVRGRLSNSSKR